MLRALPLPRQRRVGGDPVDHAFASLRETARPTGFLVQPDTQRAGRAAKQATLNSRNRRFAAALLRRLDAAR